MNETILERKQIPHNTCRIRRIETTYLKIKAAVVYRCLKVINRPRENKSGLHTKTGKQL